MKGLLPGKERLNKLTLILSSALIFTLLISVSVYALDGKVLNPETEQMEAVPEAKFWADTIWTVLTAMLVFFMQAGQVTTLPLQHLVFSSYGLAGLVLTLVALWEQMSNLLQGQLQILTWQRRRVV